MIAVGLPRWARWPLWGSLALLTLILGIAGSITPVYYLVMTLVAAPLVLRHQARLTRWLQSAPLPRWPRIAAFGYGAVIAEETLVGTIFALQERSLGAWPERVAQFVGFNVFAFTGIVVGLAACSHLWRFESLDTWLIVGGFGLFSEGIIFRLASQPVAAVALALPTMAVYSVIFAPAVLSVRADEWGKRAWPLPVRLVTAWTIIGVASLIPVAIVMALRAAHPDAFPPCVYIPCG